MSGDAGEFAIAALCAIRSLPPRDEPSQEVRELRLIAEETLGRIRGVDNASMFDDFRHQIQSLTRENDLLFNSLSRLTTIVDNLFFVSSLCDEELKGYGVAREDLEALGDAIRQSRRVLKCSRMRKKFKISSV